MAGPTAEPAAPLDLTNQFDINDITVTSVDPGDASVVTNNEVEEMDWSTLNEEQITQVLEQLDLPDDRAEWRAAAEAEFTRQRGVIQEFRSLNQAYQDPSVELPDMETMEAQVAAHRRRNPEYQAQVDAGIDGLEGRVDAAVTQYGDAAEIARGNAYLDGLQGEDRAKAEAAIEAQISLFAERAGIELDPEADLETRVKSVQQACIDNFEEYKARGLLRADMNHTELSGADGIVGPKTMHQLASGSAILEKLPADMDVPRTGREVAAAYGRFVTTVRRGMQPGAEVTPTDAERQAQLEAARERVYEELVPEGVRGGMDDLQARIEEIARLEAEGETQTEARDALRGDFTTFLQEHGRDVHARGLETLAAHRESLTNGFDDAIGMVNGRLEELGEIVPEERTEAHTTEMTELNERLENLSTQREQNFAAIDRAMEATRARLETIDGWIADPSSIPSLSPEFLKGEKDQITDVFIAESVQAQRQAQLAEARQ